jgi:putative transposase
VAVEARRHERIVMKDMNELRPENGLLKKMYAEECLKAEIRQEVIEGKH